MKFLIMILWYPFLLFSEEYYYQSGKKVELTPINSPSVNSIKNYRGINNSHVKYYQSEDGSIVGIDNTILVGWKDGVDVEPIFRKFNVQIIEKLSPTIWVIKPNNSNELFSIASELYKLGETTFAHPNLIRKRELR